MDPNQIIHAKRNLYYLLLQKESDRLTPAEVDIVMLLAQDPDIRSVFIDPDDRMALEEIYAPMR